MGKLKSGKIAMKLLFIAVTFLLINVIVLNLPSLKSAAQVVLGDDDDEEDDDTPRTTTSTSTSSTAKTTTKTTTSVKTETFKDSDGDGLLDYSDPHPNIAEIYIVEDANQNGIVDKFEK